MNPEMTTEIICPNCGFHMPAGTKFCVNCGTAIPAPAPAPYAAPTPPPAPNPYAAPAPAPDPYAAPAPAPAPAPNPYAAPAPVPAPNPYAAPTPPPAPRQCSVCGRPLAENETFCSNCGHGVNVAGVPAEENKFAAYNAAVTQKKKSPIGWIIGGIAAVVAVIAVVAAIFMNSGGVELNDTSITLKRGDTYTLTYETSGSVEKSDLTWESNNTNVAEVHNGKITANGVGTCKITVTTKNGKEDTCTVTVELSDAEKQVLGQWDLNAIYNNDTEDFTWTTDWKDWWISFSDDMTGRISLGDEYDDFTWTYKSTDDDGDHTYIITITDSNADFTVQYWLSSDAVAMIVGEDAWIYEKD